MTGKREHNGLWFIPTPFSQANCILHLDKTKINWWIITILPLVAQKNQLCLTPSEMATCPHFAGNIRINFQTPLPQSIIAALGHQDHESKHSPFRRNVWIKRSCYFSLLSTVRALIKKWLLSIQTHILHVGPHNMPFDHFISLLHSGRPYYPPCSEWKSKYSGKTNQENCQGLPTTDGLLTHPD